MIDGSKTISLPSQPDEPAVDSARRRLGGLLALFGGGAALSGCAPGEESLRQSALAATGSTSTPSTAAAGAGIFWADTVAELRLTNGGASNLSIAILAGANAVGDGGEGIFRWMAAAPPTDDGGINIVPTVGQMTNAGWWYRQFEGAVSAKWFLSLRTLVSPGLYNDSPVIQAAIEATFAYFGNAGGTVYLPGYIYNCYDTINVPYDGIALLGDGPTSSRIYFLPTGATPSGDQSSGLPTTDSIAINFDNLSGNNPSLRINSCSLRHIGFSSVGSGNTLRRVAVRVVSADNFRLEDVKIENTWMNSQTGANLGSVGIQVFAGQYVRLRDYYIYAERPISIEAFSGVNYDTVDFLTIGVGGSGAASHEAHIAVGAKVLLTNFAVEGPIDWSGGRHGFRCHSTASGASHYCLSFRNIRAEQMIEATGGITDPDRGHVIYLASSGIGFQGVVVDNLRGPGTPNEVGGLYFRNAGPVRVRSVFLGTGPGGGPGTGPAWRRPIDADDTVTLDVEDFVFDSTARPQGGRYTVRQRGVATNTNGFAPVFAAPKTNAFKEGMVRVVASDAASGLLEGGTWIFDAGGAKLLSGTGSADVGNVNKKLCVDIVGGQPYLRTNGIPTTPGGMTVPSTVDYMLDIEYTV